MKAKRPDDSGNSVPLALPTIGLSKWAQIAPFIPMCRESWRKLGLAGKAPQPIRMSRTHSCYSNAEVHRWLADPLGYRANADLGEAA
ncbi:transcriptional regulator [Burkholderia multivorans]|uniref:Transcriptional regulator n=1 Tax=Burkholderia pseudomultivorans TaxID=1207504 RepID=A0A6P2HG15_9BURK|nr:MULTISPECIES: transcriptional regulator [Burkholderia cepacia complex]MBU9184373.1 transcriptional regulator [Burkholderia multivorans]MBU9598361.1 transcriptional regulator [Burkholderia multivorans]MCA8485013.1 transcriptional regulator [Burkholderia multivorans]MDN7451335.1 transcriptional regulator [Burkholderia multivorans]VWB15485.1 transcriptional regulator [Burkholderia pseudomultivorans]